ncbi:MAG: DUF5395 domain-containing protein [Nitrospirota bacterium]
MLLECTIRHDGANWVVEHGTNSISAPTLEELDRGVERYLKEEGLLKAGEKAEVFMAFDNSTIPQWIRQYSQHYFNRIVEVKG